MDETSSPSYASFANSLQDGCGDIRKEEHAKEDNGHEHIPQIVIHQSVRKTTGISCLASNHDINPLGSKSGPEDEKSPIERGATIQLPTSAKTVSSDERGRSQPAPKQESSNYYESLQRTFEINIELIGPIQPFKIKKITCIAISTKGRKDQPLKCRNRISQASLIEARKVLKSLALTYDTHDSKERAAQLEGLARLLVCKNSYHQGVALAFAQAWEAAITPVSERQIVLPPLTILAKTIAPAVSKKVTTTSGEFDTSEACIRRFIPYGTRTKSHINKGGFVRVAIERNLTLKEITGTGFIYIYWFPGNFGHIKIGYTTQTVEERLHQWESQCGHKTHPEFPISEEDQKPIPHVRRVENILKALLRNSRRKEIGCRGCGKCHDEWFESSEQEVIAAVRKLSAWMGEDPYEELPNGSWRLKENQKDKVKALCETLLIPPEARPRSVSTSRLKERNASSSRRLLEELKPCVSSGRNQNPGYVECQRTLNKV